MLSDSADTARYAGAAQRYAKASKAHRPAQPIGLVAAPAGIVSQEAFYSRTLANALSLTWMSVQPSTLETYGNGWRQWEKWSEQFGTDPFMQTRPACFGQGTAGVFPLLLTFFEVCALSFLAWLSVERELKPSTCSGYLSAVRFVLNRSNIDTSCMETNQDGDVDCIPLHTPGGG